MLPKPLTQLSGGGGTHKKKFLQPVVLKNWHGNCRPVGGGVGMVCAVGKLGTVIVGTLRAHQVGMVRAVTNHASVTTLPLPR